MSPDPAKKTVGEKKQGVEVRLTLTLTFEKVSVIEELGERYTAQINLVIE